MATDLRDEDEIVSGINITPLVDVVLVLLVIFMMTAPMIYQQSIEVDLPKASTGQKDQGHSPIEITINKAGQIYLEKDLVQINDLPKLIEPKIKVNKDLNVMIHADQKTEHGKVIEVMDALRKQGLFKYSLSVETVSNLK